MTVMTTHSMEEADILGDNIAIMASGQLRSVCVCVCGVVCEGVCVVCVKRECVVCVSNSARVLCVSV